MRVRPGLGGGLDLAVPDLGWVTSDALLTLGALGRDSGQASRGWLASLLARLLGISYSQRERDAHANTTGFLADRACRGVYDVGADFLPGPCGDERRIHRMPSGMRESSFVQVFVESVNDAAGWPRTLSIHTPSSLNDLSGFACLVRGKGPLLTRRPLPTSQRGFPARLQAITRRALAGWLSPVQPGSANRLDALELSAA